MTTSTQKNLFKNSFFNLLKTFCGIAFPVVTFAYAARVLGEEGVGRVVFSKAYVSYFSLLALLGMNQYGTREVAKRRANRTELSKFTHEMLLINACTTTVAYALLFLSIMVVPRLHGYTGLLSISSVAIVLQGFGLEWLYQGLEEYRYIAIRSLVFQIAALMAMFLFVHNENDTAGYAAVTVIASYGSYILNFINARKYIDLKWYGNYRLRQHLRPLLWLFAMAISIELYTVLDSTMLGLLQGDAAVGRYTAAVKANKVASSLIVAVSAVLIPRLSLYMDRREWTKVRALVENAYNYVFLLAVPIAVGLFMFSDEIILLFSGSGFHSAAFTMRILIPIVLVIPFSVATNQQTFIPMGKEKLILYSTITGAVTNFIFNAILIPRYAENGAAVATVIAETAVAFVGFVNAKKYFDMRAIFKCYYQYLLSVLPIPLVILVVKRVPVHYVVQMVLGATISAGCYFALLLWQRNEYLERAIEIMKKGGRNE